jgi:hypothetical protein
MLECSNTNTQYNKIFIVDMNWMTKIPLRVTNAVTLIILTIFMRIVALEHSPTLSYSELLDIRIVAGLAQ